MSDYVCLNKFASKFCNFASENCINQGLLFKSPAVFVGTVAGDQQICRNLSRTNQFAFSFNGRVANLGSGCSRSNRCTSVVKPKHGCVLDPSLVVNEG